MQTLENNLDIGNYKEKSTFVKDLQKIFDNAKKYNKPSTYYYKSAKELEVFIENDIKKLSEC